jgi:hypothetical protein
MIAMPKKRHKPEEIVAKLRQVHVLVSQGQSRADAVRSIGVTEVTYYCWQQEYGTCRSRLITSGAKPAFPRRAYDALIDFLVIVTILAVRSA